MHMDLQGGNQVALEQMTLVMHMWLLARRRNRYLMKLWRPLVLPSIVQSQQTSSLDGVELQFQQFQYQLHW